MHLRDCQRSALVLLVTLKSTGAAGFPNAEKSEAVNSFFLHKGMLGVRMKMQIGGNEHTLNCFTLQ